jgi:hypothetical protein
VGAFLHEGTGELTIVAINPTDREQPLNLTVRNLRGLTSLKAFRTSAAENLKAVGEVAVTGNTTTFPMAPQSIVTLAGAVAK